MEKSFLELHRALKRCRQECPWTREQELEKQADEIVSEAAEFKEAVEKNDVGNMREELGDLIMDILFVSVIAEEKGLFTLKDALDEVYEKLRRRTPWVFGNEKVSTKEEAVQRWKEIKEEEKGKKGEARLLSPRQENSCRA